MKLTKRLSLKLASSRRKAKNKLKISNNQQSSPMPDLSQLQLLVYRQLQKSLNVTELLELYQKVLPDSIGVSHVFFTPAYQSKKTDGRPLSDINRKIKLYTGERYLGELCVEFTTMPHEELYLIAAETAKLIAFPLMHAMVHEQALQSSELDQLTHLKNRKAMSNALRKTADNVKRHGITSSILMLDIDYFKRINDTYGHLIGDKLLQKLAVLVKQSCRLTDDAYRFGGDEFLIILPNTCEAGAIELAERLRKSIEMNDFSGIIDEKYLPISISIGLASIAANTRECSIEQVVQAADQALYQAKKAGRNQSYCHSLQGSMKSGLTSNDTLVL